MACKIFAHFPMGSYDERKKLHKNLWEILRRYSPSHWKHLNKLANASILKCWNKILIAFYYRNELTTKWNPYKRIESSFQIMYQFAGITKYLISFSCEDFERIRFYMSAP